LPLYLQTGRPYWRHWAQYVERPGERMVHCGPVKKQGRFINNRRQLILAAGAESGPRLVYIDPSSLKLKGEIPLLSRVGGGGGRGGVGGGGSSGGGGGSSSGRMTPDGARESRGSVAGRGGVSLVGKSGGALKGSCFDLTDTNGRTHVFEDLRGHCGRWLQLIGCLAAGESLPLSPGGASESNSAARVSELALTQGPVC
jgi:hypothetical protein